MLAVATDVTAVATRATGCGEEVMMAQRLARPLGVLVAA